MRSIVLVVAVLAAAVPLTLLAPTASAADGCPSYERTLGTSDAYAAASTDDGAVMAYAASYYVWSDAPARDGWLYYLALGQESNGVPGPQRSDERCDQTGNGAIEGDCGWLCTF